MDVQDFLNLLNGVRGSGTETWAARCPCRNDDANPSLSIALGDRKQILVKCHRGGGCDLDTILESLNLKMADLWPDGPSDKRPEKPVKEFPKEKLELVATYRYRDPDGEILYEKRRYLDESGRKTFRARHWADGKWIWNMGGPERAVLYRLPEIQEAITNQADIYIVEGEKDVDNLIDAGYVATTSPHGAGVWEQKFTDSLVGATEIFVISDADRAGRDHAEMILRELEAAGIPASGWEPPAPHKDVTDLLEAGLTLDSLIPLGEEAAPNSGDPVLSADGGVNSQTGPQKIDAPKIKLDKIVPVRRWDDFVAEGDAEYDWLVPGILERGERVIVVAAEGVGKTYLARQVAICCAAGIQPFTQSTMPPIRTLSIDLENPERIIRRTTRDLLGKVQLSSKLREVHAYLWTVPAGLDLLNAADRDLFEAALEEAKPDLLVMGPLYKAFVDQGVRSSDQVALELVKYLDEVRVWFGCGLWLEHHAPLGSGMSSRDLRPFGSSVWSRWPEFGLSLSVDVTAEEAFCYRVGHFRGPRDERHWPVRMRRGKFLPFEVMEFQHFTT